MKANLTRSLVIPALGWLITAVSLLFAPSILRAQLPELIYYQFEDGNTSVNNHAQSPVGTSPAPISGTLTTAPGGFLASNALSGTGSSSSGNTVNTGWNTSISGSFTLAFYTRNVPPSSTLYYIFGDAGASSFRCFTNGVAGANNWMLRGATLPDLLVSGAASMTGNMIHAVYDATAGTYTSYVDGVQNTQVTVIGTPNVTGSGLTVGGYSSSTGLNGLLDEFRWYNRALSATEIQSTYNVNLLSGGGCPAPANLDSVSAGCDSIRISWNSGTGSSLVHYGPQGFSTSTGGTLTGTVTSPFTLTGLPSGTAYDFYVADTCGSDTSFFIGPITVATEGTVVMAQFASSMGPVTATQRLVYFNASASQGATAYLWDFGDGQTGTGVTSSNFYQANGQYPVKLVIDGSSCGKDSIVDTVVVEEIGQREWMLAGRTIELYPNPAHQTLRLLLSDHDLRGTWRIVMYDLSGRKYREEMRQFEPAESNLELDVSGLSAGVYLLLLEREGQAFRSSFAVR